VVLCVPPSPSPPQRLTVEGRTVRSTTCARIEVEGTILDFGFLKKFFDISLLSTYGRVLYRCQAFDLFASVDAQSLTFHSFRPKVGY
jgi:hypothetical protein